MGGMDYACAPSKPSHRFCDHIMRGGSRQWERIESMIAAAINIAGDNPGQTIEIPARYPIMLAVQSSVAQLVERTAVNRMVAGSSPARGAKSSIALHFGKSRLERITRDLGERMTKPLPRYEDLLWPTLKALEKEGGSASIRELSERVAAYLALPDEILEVAHKDGPQSEVDYRAAWARTHLKFIGAVDNTSRGVWTITEIGRRIRTEEELRHLNRQERAKRRELRRTGDDEVDAETSELDWQGVLLDIVRRVKPDAFERLCQLVLRESGFTKVEVTGRSGDGGIDGAGVLRVNLISFHVRFQCKRFKGSVGAPEIRDFRGAMVGRADKGLFISTGSFTKDAEREAVRDGAPAIDLIDGIALCSLLKSLSLGVSTTTRTVEVVEPRPEFFESL